MRHSDVMGLNIMMDARPMYPNMYHPRAIHRNRDFKGQATYLSRTARPVQYYLVDFGLSRKYDADNKAPLEDPIWGGDKSVPEFQHSDDAQNPFPTDIYYTGNMIRMHFFQVCAQCGCVWVSLTEMVAVGQKARGLEFMSSLVEDMVQDDPKKRPTMDEVVDRFDALRNSLSWFTLRSRLVYGEESVPGKVLMSTTHAIQTCFHIVAGRNALPTPAPKPSWGLRL